MACAAIPPAPPSGVFRDRGTRCTTLGGGCAPSPRAVGREGFVLACQRARGRGWAGFPRLQPHSLIVCDSLIVCAPAFSSPVGVEPLQRRYKALQAVTRALQSRYESLHSRYGAVTDLTSRYGVGRLQRACALQRHSLRSRPSSEGLAPRGVPSAPLPRGTLHGEPPVHTLCGRLREREAGRGPTSLGVL